MLFDSLRVYAIAVDEKHKDLMVPHRRPRADLKAAAVMREHGLWLNRDKRVVGDIPGVSIGDVFFFRMELCVIGLHGQPQAGLIMDVIVYTGHGGQDKNNKQVVHQKLECGNLALERSMNYGIEDRKSGGNGQCNYEVAASLRTRPLDARPRGYVTLDLSSKKENFPIFFYNDVDKDHDPLYYEYLTNTVFPPYVYHCGSTSGCDCVGGCVDDCFCAKKNGGEFPYNLQGILVRGKPLIFECGPHCRCPPSCRNRVAQKGVRNRFEVFRSTETGWGEVLGLDPGWFFYLREWGNLSEVFCDYKCPEEPSTPPLDFAMDVSRMRNVACYMSHSSSPNVLVQLVLYDHNNVSFPHLMLFAMENIPPMRELSLDYGVADEYMGKLAICN
ncbi:Histone-lysine N-methyltransferase family member SUVH9 [Sesamum angolense]|uniref:Histone-lysine N-methyltransferase family member SUVH9 n=1 Tax=Sesamum angolense TaxID=2727404 RepID=A0AAE1X791_9LAMI|nr:Histone-lysine N-methyltransferase family member SUVH9 [Sesamum angolense]